MANKRDMVISHFVYQLFQDVACSNRVIWTNIPR